VRKFLSITNAKTAGTGSEMNLLGFSPDSNNVPHKFQDLQRKKIGDGDPDFENFGENVVFHPTNQSLNE
jgi:hypothetical protein